MLTYFTEEKKTFPNSNNDEEKSDESAFSDSDEDPDYSPLQTRPSTSLQEDDFTDYSSSDDQVLDYGSTVGITLNAQCRKFATN